MILGAEHGETAAMMSGWIQAGVATATKVCVYDRAANGRSGRVESPRDGVAIATDLHTILSRAR